ncbi:MAG: hypothetical protein DMF97_17940 [Acidobacteria bacterium]|nr:MAG: hypothetical protein DMF97_17940 [Acidobacteriota bacterium]
MSAPTQRPRQLSGKAITAPTNGLLTRASPCSAHACVPLEAGAEELLAAIHDPFRNRVHRGSHVGDLAPIREHGKLAGEIGGHDRPAGHRDPGGGAIHDVIGDCGRLERGVHRAHDIQQRASPLDAAPQRALKHADLGGKIQTRRVQGNLARPAEPRPRLAGRPHLIQRDGRARGSTRWCHP